MEYMGKLQSLDFYSTYFMVVTVITSYVPWFDATASSWMLVVILFALPHLLVRLFVYDKRIKRKLKKNKIARGYTGVLGCFLALPGVILQPDDEVMPSVVLCMVLFLITISLCFYTLACDGKRKVLYQNPSVSQSVREREEKVSIRNFRRILFIAMGGTIVVAALFFGDSEEKSPVSMEGRQEETRVVEKQEKVKNKQRQLEKIKEENEEAKENLFLRIFRHVLLVALIVLTVYIIFYAIFHFILYLLRGGRKTEVEYIEEKIEDNGSEEYVRLVPLTPRSVEFPNDNNGIVRKKFYHIMKKRARPSKVNITLTPLEMTKEYFECESNRDDFVKIYEKARYSGERITDEEVTVFTQIQHK